MKSEIKFPNLEIMQNFSEENLPSLCVCVLGALELFIKEGLPNVKIKDFKKPIIVGSGNAKTTANVLYGDSDAIFADENNYKEALLRKHDGAIIFSASGEKHATIVSKYYNLKGVKTQLLTCNENSSAGKILGKENIVVTKKNREPYTYNTSTYLGWIFAKTREDPKKIYDFIQKNVDKVIREDIANFNGYLLVVPDEFASECNLFHVKFKELFARRVARDVETFEQLKHAVTVVPYEKELCIQFGEGKIDFGKERLLKIPLPKNCGPAAMMAIGYYVIGKIQEGKPQYFKKNIRNYILNVNKSGFGKGLKVIVE